MVDRIGMHFGSPHVGDIAVFHPSKEAEQDVCGVTHPPTEACPVAQKQIYVKGGHVCLNGARAISGRFQAADGNRTRIIALEGQGSAIELPPHDPASPADTL